VIVVGSINVDFTVHALRLPRAGETVVGGAFQRSGGGKGANQAVAAARAGGQVTFVGAVGADDLGDAALAELSAEGVDTRLCHRFLDTATGIALIVVDPSGDNQIAVASGANRALRGTFVDEALSGFGGMADDVVVTNFELEDDAVRFAIAWATAHGARAVLNPAPARLFDRSILGLRPILTPNEHEAAELTGKPDPEQAARALQGETNAPVIVTLGSRGALLLDADSHATTIPALPVLAVDATGAGDALNGILAAELASGSSIELALRRAVAGASLSTTEPGARAGMPTREQIDRALGS
jgi:ribokinase